MTCRDCKNKTVCKSVFKSYKVGEDGDSWANWCDEFESVHKTQEIEKDGYKIRQSGYNFHIYIFDNAGKVLLHAQCTKKKSKKELEEMVEFYEKTLPKLIKMIDKEEK